MTDDMRPIVLIAGPTAGGKTALSIELATTLPGGGECLCADSMQVYRGMDIGTAKPTDEERRRAPHHLVDIADPADDSFSVDTWLDHAESVIAEIRSRGRWPIVVGGTNLYMQALLFGLFDGPAPDPTLRARLAALDPATLRAELDSVDPDAAARIHPNDRKRSIRALEVFHATGRPLSAQQQEWTAPRPRPDAVIIGLDYPAELINPRINARVRAMIDEGLVAEVEALWRAGRFGPQAREALGYRQIIDHLEGETTLEAAVEQIKIRTRRFAKQQRTWLRRFRPLPKSRWIDMSQCDLPEAIRLAGAGVLELVSAPDPAEP